MPVESDDDAGVDGTVLTDDQTSVQYTIMLVAQRAMLPTATV